MKRELKHWNRVKTADGAIASVTDLFLRNGVPMARVITYLTPFAVEEGECK